MAAGKEPSIPTAPPCMICASPYFHVSGLNCQLVMALASGMTIVYPPQGKWREDVHLELTQKHGATIVVARPDAAVAAARVARPRPVRPLVADARRRRQLDVGARAAAHARSEVAERPARARHRMGDDRVERRGYVAALRV